MVAPFRAGFSRALAFLALLTVAAGCQEDRVQRTSSGIEVLAEAVDFGRVYTGDVATQHVRIRNTGRAEQGIRLWREGSTSFRVSPETLILGAGESRDFDIGLSVYSPGGLLGSAVVLPNDGAPVRVRLVADAKPLLTCQMPDPCTDSRFDRETGTCVETRRGDGAACVSPNKCLKDTSCVAGQCVGAAVDCDDRNVCTDDSCDPGAGCLHTSLAGQCKPSGPCKVPFCDPRAGCGERDAQDGSYCGTKDCVTKHVCRTGACMTEQVQDGESCGANGPCEDQGTCSAGVCNQPKLQSMRRKFSYSAKEGGGDRPGIATAPLLDDAGRLYFVERAQGSYVMRSLEKDGAERWASETLEKQGGAAPEHTRMFWNGKLAYVSSDCVLKLLDPATGATSSTTTLGVRAADGDGLRCTAVSAGPNGGLAVAGMVTRQQKAQKPRGFVGVVTKDLGFNYRLVGAEGRTQVDVGPLAFDGQRVLGVVSPEGEAPQLGGFSADLTPLWWAGWERRGSGIALAPTTLVEPMQGVVLDSRSGKRFGTLFPNVIAGAQTFNPGVATGFGNYYAVHWECPAGGCNGTATLVLAGFDANLKKLFQVPVADAALNPPNDPVLPVASVALDKNESVYVAVGDQLRAFYARGGGTLFGCPATTGVAGARNVVVGQGELVLTTRDEVIGLDVPWSHPGEGGWTREAGNPSGDGTVR